MGLDAEIIKQALLDMAVARDREFDAVAGREAARLLDNGDSG